MALKCVCIIKMSSYLYNTKKIISYLIRDIIIKKRIHYNNVEDIIEKTTFLYDHFTREYFCFGSFECGMSNMVASSFTYLSHQSSMFSMRFWFYITIIHFSGHCIYLFICYFIFLLLWVGGLLEVA